MVIILIEVVVAFIEYMTDVAMIMGATNRTLTKEKMTEVYRFEKQLAKVRLKKNNEYLILKYIK